MHDIFMTYGDDQIMTRQVALYHRCMAAQILILNTKREQQQIYSKMTEPLNTDLFA